LKQQEFSVTTFATALIGEGALFFAYGELTAQSGQHLFVRVAIILLGLGTGLVLTLLSYIARGDAIAALDALPANSPYRKAYADIHRWRHRHTGRGRFERRVVKPITQVMIYVNGLIVWMWTCLLLLVTVPLRPFYGISPEGEMALMGGLGILVSVVLLYAWPFLPGTEV
jgi:hypothetical protein